MIRAHVGVRLIKSHASWTSFVTTSAPAAATKVRDDDDARGTRPRSRFGRERERERKREKEGVTDSRDRWRERSTHARWRLRNSARVLSDSSGGASRSVSDARSLAWCVRVKRIASTWAAEIERNRASKKRARYILRLTFSSSPSLSLASSLVRFSSSCLLKIEERKAFFFVRRRSTATLRIKRSEIQPTAGQNMKTFMENQLSWVALFTTALYSREYRPQLRPVFDEPASRSRLNAISLACNIYMSLFIYFIFFHGLYRSKKRIFTSYIYICI